MFSDIFLVSLGIIFVVLCFAVGGFLGNRKVQIRKSNRARSTDSLPLSAFSTFDHPAAKNDREKFNPVAEAEVFMIYGKKSKAQDVLKAGFSQGLLSPEDVDAFWARHP